MVLPYDNMDYGQGKTFARNITELTDVELTNLANNQILKYNSTTEMWENSNTPDTITLAQFNALEARVAALE
mgnify:CR=1 FL=1